MNHPSYISGRSESPAFAEPLTDLVPSALHPDRALGSSKGELVDALTYAYPHCDFIELDARRSIDAGPLTGFDPVIDQLITSHLATPTHRTRSRFLQTLSRRCLSRTLRSCLRVSLIIHQRPVLSTIENVLGTILPLLVNLSNHLPGVKYFPNLTTLGHVYQLTLMTLSKPPHLLLPRFMPVPNRLRPRHCVVRVAFVWLLLQVSTTFLIPASRPPPVIKVLLLRPRLLDVVLAE